jgi:DNA-binding NarL/FixJ family response regulator
VIPAPGVLIYSAYADERLGVAARVAGADGLLGKNSSALDLVQAIRVVHSGRQRLEPIRPGEVQEAKRSLDRQEAQILEMLLDDMLPSAIAVALRMSPASVGRRVDDILGRLCAEPPWTPADIPCDRPAA